MCELGHLHNMGNSQDFDVTVVGGGILGLSVAYKIVNRHPRLRVCVLEKEASLASHQTSHNSGVIHSGLYYKPGSAKARMCTQGRQELIEFASTHDIPFRICGKIVVATEERELPHMRRILERARTNGVVNIEEIGPERIREIEPACQGIGGLCVPGTGIIDFTKVAGVLAELIRHGGQDNQILTDHRVLRFHRDGSESVVVTGRGEVRTRLVINCAGLNSDRVARLEGVHPGVRIVPFRGDYYDLAPRAAEKVRALIYPVPDPRFPFLGVHYTRKISGTVDCGPNAVFAFKREGYTKTAFSLRDTAASLSYPGTWILFARNARYGMHEYARSVSRRLFLRTLRRFIPTIESDDIRPGKIGVRAQAVGLWGRPLDDFKIVISEHAIHVLNAPSPAATASLAIGEHICDLAAKHLDLS
jgi:L-2-hydroxyglutarate oxidase